jgi:protein-S-isoprenylcysteine O-methyltransferase Ste14
MNELSPEEWLALQRGAFLIFPPLAAALLLLAQKPSSRDAVAAMAAFLWQVPSLLLLHVLAAYFGWWAFAGQRNMLIGLPIDVWIGWAIWWGPVVVFLNRWIGIVWIVAGSVAIDLISMPLLKPLVTLGPNWLVGDAAAMTICLIPGLWLAKLTREDRSPKRRAMFHVLGWGGYLVLVLPVCALTYAREPLSDLYRMPAGILDWLVALAGAFLLMVGIAATAEFARMGQGTPIPFDPPKRVVSSGPYAFVANPMQMISSLFMLLLAVHAGSWALAFLAAMFLVYEGAYASWFNRANIAKAMSGEWGAYRGAVDEWQVRWRPHIAGNASVEIAPDGLSRSVWDWAWRRWSSRLEGTFDITAPDRNSFRRLTYRRDGIEETGIGALARIAEHGIAPVALLGLVMRLPYLGGFLQRLTGAIVLAGRWLRSPSG